MAALDYFVIPNLYFTLVLPRHSVADADRLVTMSELTPRGYKTGLLAKSNPLAGSSRIRRSDPEGTG